MCRVFGLFLRPTSFENFFFDESKTGEFTALDTPSLLKRLHDRSLWINRVATDCAKRCTKAGYDAAGLGVAVINVAPLLEILEQKRKHNTVFSRESISQVYRDALAPLPNHQLQHDIIYSKDGGDYLETHQRLHDRLDLQDIHFVTAWTVHIRQASQGDMYSAANAHPHFDGKGGPKSNHKTFFSTMHNGDILDADRYKEILTKEGYVFYSNADSCIIPALQRFFVEALQAKKISESIALFQPLMAHKRDLAFLAKWAEDFLRRGACLSTVSSALCARIFENSNPENKFVFQSLSPNLCAATEPSGQFLSYGSLNIVRGGTREGGEEGGEAMFYLPHAGDQTNEAQITAMVCSEENALKDQVKLIDLEVLQNHARVVEAKTHEEPLDHLRKRFPDMQASAFMTEGGLPIFDVLPGEILEINARGSVKLFSLYHGKEIPLERMTALKSNTQVAPLSEKQPHRKERMARLKRFRVEYRNSEGNLIPSPFNTFGEEIIVVQPAALRDNTKKLFKKQTDGSYEVVPGKMGLGLWFGTDDRADRANTIRKLDFKVVGAAGTSFLMATIAENMCRKLSLHRIPTLVLEGFTGSDCLPANVTKDTLFVANSNSGGTADTIKLTRELTSPTRICRNLLERSRNVDAGQGSGSEEGGAFLKKLEKAFALLHQGGREEDLDPDILPHIRDLVPHVFVITNTEASALGDMGRGLDNRIFRPAGTGVTNLPEEECVGSTFAAMASLQWMMTLDAYLGEVRGFIGHDYAKKIYASLAKLPDVCSKIVNDVRLAEEIQEFSDRCVGGNNDFIFTDYVNGVPEEQAHKFAEMIQTMSVGWHYFMFQHGKYAHVRRASRHALGSIVGHNVPPPSWPFFNARAKKAPREIKARAAMMFAIAHTSDREELLSIPDYGVDYVFTYPEDDVALYPFQAVIISQLISFYWGMELKKISDKIAQWNEHFIGVLEAYCKNQNSFTESLRQRLREKATQVLGEFTTFYTQSHRLDNSEVRRINAIFRDLYLLSETASPDRDIAIEALLGSPKIEMHLKGQLSEIPALTDVQRLTILKDVALEISTSSQAKRIADLFLTDDLGRVKDQTISFKEISGRTRVMKEYDYWCQYEGLGEFYHVNPVHPPKIAKAKKGWL